jgi:hypothetical protein
VNMARASYSERLFKLNRFNGNGVFGRDRYAPRFPSFGLARWLVPYFDRGTVGVVSETSLQFG